MRVHHVSSAPPGGGAARAGLRLHRGLSQLADIESLWLDADVLPDTLRTRQLRAPRNHAFCWNRVRRWHWRGTLNKGFAGTGTPYSNPIGRSDASVFQGIPRPDIWNLHWVANHFDWERLLPWLAEQAPIVWTLHDTNPLMGVWHFVPFPAELNANRRRVEQEAVKFKTKILSRIPKDRLTFVAPSEWMLELCRRSPVTEGFPVIHIPGGLDTEVFSPKDKEIAQSMFAIPNDVMVLGFAAQSLSDSRKGIRELETAIHSLPSSRKIHLLTAGGGDAPAFKVPHTHLGPVSDDERLSFFYSACDLFICPSLQDNLPNTVMESMACGTPVVAFETGGLPDLVRAGVSGKLATPSGDPLALAAAISELLSDADRLLKMRALTRALAVNEYGLGVCAGQYRELYAHVCGQKLV